jgi:hypothetical protein
LSRDPHEVDLLVVDAEGQTVFDSRDAIEFDMEEWGALLRTIQWESATAVCRLVQYGGWEPDTEPVSFPSYMEPESAVLDERTLERRLPRVTSMRVDAGSKLVETLRWQYGHNLTFDVETPDPADGERRKTYVTVNVQPGTGRGVFPADCEDSASRYVTQINGVTADEHGSFTLDAGDCYRLERPIFEELESGVRRAVAVIDHTLQIFNDCGPCCSCDDFINTYEGIRRLRDRYADLYERANAVRAQYLLNLQRFSDQRECRVNDPLRLTVRPLCHDELAVAVGFCNNTGRCLNNLIIPISFEYNDIAGDVYPGTTDPVVFETEYAAGSPYIPPDNVFRAGNRGGSSAAGSSAVPELYALGGEYPYLYAAFDRVDPGSSASVVFRLSLPYSTPADTVRIAIDAYEGPGDLGGGGPLAIPIPGYTPGGGPSTPEAVARRLSSGVKFVESGVLQGCGMEEESLSE